MVGKRLELVVSEAEAGVRLDKVVLRHAEGIGRRLATRLFRQGAVRADGKRVRAGAIARAGQTITVELPGERAIEPEPAASLGVLLERADLVAVDKPAGIPTAPLRPGEVGSLAGALLGRYPEMAGIGHRAREPGLVHRLDTGTSGIVLAARTKPAFEHLTRALVLGALDKRYLAVVPSAGLPGEGEIDEPLAPVGRGRRRVGVVRPGRSEARPAVTQWSKRSVAGAWALVEVRVHSAYRHQVRAHLAHIGHPIAGDLLYGGSRVDTLSEGRHALHASYVAWTGDEVIEGFAVDSPLPLDLAAFFDGR